MSCACLQAGALTCALPLQILIPMFGVRVGEDACLACPAFQRASITRAPEMAGLASMRAADLRTAEGIPKGPASAREAHRDTAPMSLKLVVLMRVGCLIAEVRTSFNDEACKWLSLLRGWYGLFMIRHLRPSCSSCARAHASSNVVCVVSKITDPSIVQIGNSQVFINVRYLLKLADHNIASPYSASKLRT